jgi:uncharacterized protein YjbI with pentapeptide repeats
MLSELKKIPGLIPSELKKFSRPITIGLICVFGFTFGFTFGFGSFLDLPKLWPGGIGIGKDKSVTTTVETIEKDKQGKAVKKVTITAHNDGKTLWDWGSLLGVPLSLVILGYVLQQQQQKRAEKLSEEQRKIADNETKEEVLQNYFDRLSVLLIDKNLIALSNKSNLPKITSIALSNKSQLSTITPEEQELLDSSLDVIRARTLSILRRFENDAKRKASVINFLIETEIVGKSKLNLSQANLQGADLLAANLQGANLQRANLQRAVLYHTKLQGANLQRAELQWAELQWAELQGANLQGAKLQGAELQGANLQGAELQGAKLQGANLQRANLQRANLRVANLQRANLQRANLQMTELQMTELQMTELQEANLEKANLQRANLEKANLQGAKLKGANLERADLKDIKWNSKTVWPDKSKFASAKNIPEELEKELGITP